MWFDTWQSLERIALIGMTSYLGVVVLLRLSGKRTLAKWNAFDFIVTIALGSTLASALLDSQIAYAEGMLAFSVLVALQFVISWLSVRSGSIRKLTRSEPRYLYRDGGFVLAARTERVTEAEVRAAVRGSGVASMNEVLAVVLEADGSVSVIRKSAHDDESAMLDVRQ
jgi:uncharacterized membrane protein YcaP (DUF421 family)